MVARKELEVDCASDDELESEIMADVEVTRTCVVELADKLDCSPGAVDEGATGATVVVDGVDSETEVDAAGTDEVGVLIRDTEVVEAAVDEVESVVMIWPVEVATAVTVVGLGAVRRGSADVVKALHSDPSP